MGSRSAPVRIALGLLVGGFALSCGQASRDASEPTPNETVGTGDPTSVCRAIEAALDVARACAADIDCGTPFARWPGCRPAELRAPPLLRVGADRTALESALGDLALDDECAIIGSECLRCYVEGARCLGSRCAYAYVNCGPPVH